MAAARPVFGYGVLYVNAVFNHRPVVEGAKVIPVIHFLHTEVPCISVPQPVLLPEGCFFSPLLRLLKLFFPKCPGVLEVQLVTQSVSLGLLP